MFNYFTLINLVFQSHVDSMGVSDHSEVSDLFITMFIVIMVVNLVWICSKLLTVDAGIGDTSDIGDGDDGASFEVRETQQELLQCFSWGSRRST